jgi:hypothetical protein
MAAASVAGMDSLVVRYYTTESLAERGLLKGIFEKGIKIDGDRREDQANRIISALSDALSRKKTKAHSHG